MASDQTLASCSQSAQGHFRNASVQMSLQITFISCSRMGPRCTGASGCSRAGKLPHVQVLLWLGESMVSACPHSLSLVSCRFCEAELRSLVTACPDLRVFPVRQSGLGMQVAPPITAAGRSLTLPLGMRTELASALHNKHQLWCPGRMPSKIMYMTP